LKASLTVREASFVLGLSYMRVWRLAKRGDLRHGATGIEPDSVTWLAERLSPREELPLRRQALRLILAGRLAAPKPVAGRWSPPPPITDLAYLLENGSRRTTEP
jgi:hypothetical protein